MATVSNVLNEMASWYHMTLRLGQLADLGGGGEGRTPLMGIQILSILCSFQENFIGAPVGSWCPLLGEFLDPPLSGSGLFLCKTIASSPSRPPNLSNLWFSGCSSNLLVDWLSSKTCFRPHRQLVLLRSKSTQSWLVEQDAFFSLFFFFFDFHY